MILPSTSPLPSTTTTTSSFSFSRVSPTLTKTPLGFLPPHRLSFASCSSSSSSSTPSFGFGLRSSARRSTRACVLSFNRSGNAMAELVKDKEVLEAQLATSREVKEGKEKRSHARAIREAKSGEELLSIIRTEAKAGRLPARIAAGMEELFHNYSNAVFKSGIPAANEVVLSNMTAALERIFLDAEDPFVFSPYHEAMRKPFDYYSFGQNYIRPLIDFRNSYVGNINLFNEMEENLKQGHNIVLISNHQTEADPAIIALLLERTHPYIADKLIYVAGDRVITDALCKPFSMGRNLICVYSKKHMFDVPELAEMKKKANIKSLKEMGMLFRTGSKPLWIAPSGGRDRPDPLTGKWYPVPFEASSVDNLRRLSEHSDAPPHFYPIALLCHDIMPPPAQVEKEIGEKRLISFTGVGLSIAPEISFQKVSAACKKPEEAKEFFSRALYDSVLEQYNVLNSAILGKTGVKASTQTISLSQPWK